MTPSPVQYPTVTIAGRAYILKFDMLAKLRMSQLGVRPSDFRILAVREGESPDPGIVAVMLKLFSCAAANNFVDPENPLAPITIPSPENWAVLIGDDLEIFKQISTATFQAMVKVTPPGSRAPGLAADQQGPATVV